jgi:hypothetical protein
LLTYIPLYVVRNNVIHLSTSFPTINTSYTISLPY